MCLLFLYKNLFFLAKNGFLWYNIDTFEIGVVNMKRMKKKKTNINLSTNVIAMLSSIIIILGTLLVFNSYITEKKLYAYNYMTINIKEEIELKKNEEITVEPDEVVDETIPLDDYIGYLEIPNIGLNKGFLRKESTHNNVEENIFVALESDYPYVNNGNLIIAGHSGTGWKAFFNDLYMLNKGDYLFITFNHKKYTYKLDNIYKQNKVGKINIYRNPKRTTLTLVTCTNNENDTQTVYIAYLENVENI